MNAKSITLLLIILSMSLIGNTQDRIPFTALAEDNEGIYGVGEGSQLPDELCAPPNINPPYYTNMNIMSADEQDVYPGYISAGHLREDIDGGVVGFENFISILEINNLDINNIHMRFTEMTKDVDQWLFEENVDTRMYTGGIFSMVYIDNGIEELMVSGNMPILRDVINYHTLGNCDDDDIYGSTEYFMPIYDADTSSVEVQSAANVFMSEIINVGMKLHFSLQTAIMGVVETGAVWSVTSGAIVKGKAPYRNMEFEFPAFGLNNDCTDFDPVMSNGFGQWIDLTVGGALVASIYDAESLGQITGSFYTNFGSVRIDGNGNEFMDRNIEITPAIQPSGDILVRLYMSTYDWEQFIDANDNDGNDPTTFDDMRMSKFDMLCSSGFGSNGVLLNIDDWGRIGAGAAGGYYFDVIVNSFSTFFVHGPSAAPLPLEFVSFTAKTNKNSIELNWETTLELNTSFFEIQRKTLDSEFKSIGRLESKNRYEFVNDYSFEDIDLVTGINYYYRIKQVDNDGMFSYSEITTATLNTKKDKIKVLYPSPAHDKLMVEIDYSLSDNNTVKIFNHLGKEIINIQISSEFTEIDLSDIESGLYFISIYNKSGDLLDMKKFNKI